uniref:Uncharacterized protein n=1 Tax=Romanomermis culicivorax TaxID=13658 RepID=A0A915JGZ1_ROMCU
RHQEEKEKSIKSSESTTISPSSPRSDATFDQKRLIFEKSAAVADHGDQNRLKIVATISRHRKFGGPPNNCYYSSYGGSFRDDRRSYKENSDPTNYRRKIGDEKPATFVAAPVIESTLPPPTLKKIAPVYSTPTQKDCRGQNDAAPSSVLHQYICVVNKPPALPGTDYKVTSLEEEKFVGKITDFLPEIERDHRQHRQLFEAGKKFVENSAADIEKESTAVDETDSQLQDSKTLSQSSRDVANIRKSFEQRIEREKSAYPSVAVPLPSTVHYSHLAFPRDKAQAAYVVSRALAQKITAKNRGLPAASSATVYQRVQKRIDQQEQENLEKESKQQQLEKQMNECLMEKEEYGMIEEGEDLKTMDKGVSNSDEKLGVTSVKRYDGETMPPVPMVRAMRSKSVCYQSPHAKED